MPRQQPKTIVEQRECETGPHEMEAHATKREPHCSICKRVIVVGERYYANKNNRHVRRHVECAVQVHAPPTKRMLGSHRGEKRQRTKQGWRGLG